MSPLPSAKPLSISLVSQMRAGTHFMCAALRLALEAGIMRPREGGVYSPMDDTDILNDLHPESRFPLPPPRPDRHIYFSHYYHPHQDNLLEMTRISLIGFPLDSFYSDGIVYSDKKYTAAPSGSRPHASSYVFRRDSEQWNRPEDRMHQNARWLSQIGRTANDLVVRYEDLYSDFDVTAARIEKHVGGFLNPMPKPMLNRKRTYWTRDFALKFDAKALSSLADIFGPAIVRLYPECAAALRQA